MKYRSILFILICFYFISPAVSAPYIEIIEAGSFKLHISPDFKNGIATEKYDPPELRENSSYLKADIGKTFGIYYAVRGHYPNEQIRLRLIIIYPHPGIFDRKTNQYSLISESNIKSTADTAQYMLFSIDEENHKIKGEWIFQIWQNNIKLSEKSFFLF